MSQDQGSHEQGIRRSPSTSDAHEGSRDVRNPVDHTGAERRVNDRGAPDGRERRGLTEREKRERWPIG